MISTWRQAQSLWLELLGIFLEHDAPLAAQSGSPRTPSLRTQLPQAAQAFDAAHATLVAAANMARRAPVAVELCAQASLQGVLEQARSSLESCARASAAFLDARGAACPRLLLLPAATVRGLLGRATRSPAAFAPFVSRLFDGAARLEFEEEDSFGASVTRVVAMVTQLGERVPLPSEEAAPEGSLVGASRGGVACDVPVEVWLEGALPRVTRRQRAAPRNHSRSHMLARLQLWGGRSARACGNCFTTRCSSAPPPPP